MRFAPSNSTRFIAAALVVAMAVMFLPACGSSPTSRSADDPRPVVVDTDMANDDILALLYLLSNPRVRVEAITVSGTGEVHCEPGVRHVRTLLAVTHHRDVPVACGPSAPLTGTVEFPAAWRDASDSFYGLSDSPGVSGESEGDAVTLLTRSVRRAGHGKVTVVALAPLTNVAAAILADPEVATRAAGIVVMGGAVDVPGNVGEPQPGAPPIWAEWNMIVDPHAANVVFDAGADVTLVSLDATNLVPLGPSFHTRLSKSAHTPAAALAYEMYARNPFLWSGGLSFWDPLAAVIVARPSVVSYTDRRVRAVEADGDQRGRTEATDSGATVRMAMAPDADAFEDELLAVLDDGRAAPPAAAPSDITVTYRGDADCPTAVRAPIAAGRVSVTIDTDSANGIAVAIGRLGAGHSFADVEALVAAHAEAPGAGVVPEWFKVVAVPQAPPTGAPTWVLDLAAGDYAAVCVSVDGANYWAGAGFTIVP